MIRIRIFRIEEAFAGFWGWVPPSMDCTESDTTAAAAAGLRLTGKDSRGRVNSAHREISNCSYC